MCGSSSGVASHGVLLVIPTYNEAGNIERLLREIATQGLPLDVLVIDDGSPDGTGAIAERLRGELPMSIRVAHRPAKLGIGSAHKAGFTQAIEHGYAYVMTMDADFAHQPCYLRTMLEKAGAADVVIGSRYLDGGGLVGWNLARRLITHTAHWLTGHLLRLPYDCTGGFRLYRVACLRALDYAALRSDGYAFLTEMLWHLKARHASIEEVPIVINFRHQGRSKISHAEIFKAIVTLLRLSLRRQPSRAPHPPSSGVGMDWDQYWRHAQEKRGTALYDVIAEFYRSQIIARSARRLLSRFFSNEPGRHYLHAGCGSGGSDQRLALDQPTMHALDLSPVALMMNRRRPIGCRRHFVCGDLFRLPYRANSMDGAFNFGVMEHFTEPDIDRILAELHRVLKPDGHLILFWPPTFGLSVMALTSLLWVVNRIRRRPLVLYPDEVSRITSFRWVRALMARNHFHVVHTEFGWRDLFTFVVVVARPLPRPLGEPEALSAGRAMTGTPVEEVVEPCGS